MKASNYQDSVTAPLSRDFDDDAVAQDDNDSEDIDAGNINSEDSVLSGVAKVCNVWHSTVFPINICLYYHLASRYCTCPTIQSTAETNLARTSHGISKRKEPWWQ